MIVNRWSLEIYIVVNFKACRISRDARKLARIIYVNKKYIYIYIYIYIYFILFYFFFEKLPNIFYDTTTSIFANRFLPFLSLWRDQFSILEKKSITGIDKNLTCPDNYYACTNWFFFFLLISFKKLAYLFSSYFFRCFWIVLTI
jgi:hypothetical protein